jgi:hypothetical protein
MRQATVWTPKHARPSPNKREKDHGDRRRDQRHHRRVQTVEQGQAGRTQTSAAAETRLGHSAPLADRKTHAELALFNLAIDSKLRGRDVVSLKVEDVAPHGYAVDRATVPLRVKSSGRSQRLCLSALQSESGRPMPRSCPAMNRRSFRDQLAFSIGFLVSRSRDLLRRLLEEHVADDARQ